MIARMMNAAKRMFALTITRNFAKQRIGHRISEWHMASVMLAVGIVLTLSDTFNLPPYEVVRQIARQEAWALLMIFIGAARLVALVVNGAWPRATGHARYILASMSFVTWALLVAGLFSFGTPLLLGPFLVAASIIDLITAFRAAQDAREADETSGVGDGTKSR